MPHSEACPDHARLSTWEIVFPDHANHLGTLFGGQALAWMDKAAFLVASRVARCVVVTARAEPVDFHAPVRIGQAVELIARLVGRGRTSLRVEVEMHAEDLDTGERRRCARGGFVLVSR